MARGRRSRICCAIGVYTDSGDPRAAPRFLPLPPLGEDDLARAPAGTARRLERLVAERAGGDEDALARDDGAAPGVAVADMIPQREDLGALGLFLLIRFDGVLEASLCHNPYQR